MCFSSAAGPSSRWPTATRRLWCRFVTCRYLSLLVVTCRYFILKVADSDSQALVQVRDLSLLIVTCRYLSLLLTATHRRKHLHSSGTGVCCGGSWVPVPRTLSFSLPIC